VTVVRAGLDVSRTSGFVVGLSTKWVVLHELADGVYLDGIVMLRRDLITRAERDSGYLARASEELRQRPRHSTWALDATTADLLR